LLATGKVIILAEALEIYGQFLVESERIPQAAVSFGGAHGIWKESGAALDVDTRAASNRAVSRAQQAIGSVEFDRFWDLGESSGSEHVLRLLRLSNIAQRPADFEGSSVLSERELEVLGLVAEGLTDREIGEVLFVSPRTVATHMARILDKLGVESRTAAATMAVRQGLI
jgi:DNA-binding NarL/FixJ family response regulator